MSSFETLKKRVPQQFKNCFRGISHRIYGQFISLQQTIMEPNQCYWCNSIHGHNNSALVQLPAKQCPDIGGYKYF